MRDYATKKAESLEPLLQRLDSEVRRFGRITKKDIDEVFDELRAKNDITSSQSLLVIRCCGKKLKIFYQFKSVMIILITGEGKLKCSTSVL